MKGQKKLMNQKGVSAIEFVLVLPVLLAILFGTVEYGWRFKTQMEFNNAASDAARAVVAEPGQDPRMIATMTILEALQLSIPPRQFDYYFLRMARRNDPKRVEIDIKEYPYKSLTGFFPSSLLPMKISAKAVAAYP
jgi:hypothetical protein